MMNKRILQPITIIIILAVLISGGIWYYEHSKLYPSTDDAYVQAHVVYIAARVDGKVQQVFVKDNQFVKKGELLFTIDPKPFQETVNKAQADLANISQQVKAAGDEVVAAQAMVAQRRAQLINTRKETSRILTLARQRLVSLEQADQARERFKVANAGLQAAVSQLHEALSKLGLTGEKNAQIRAAKAALAQAVLQLQYTHVTAPADGYLVKFNLQPGSAITAYNELFALVKNDDWWVAANYKETDLGRIRPGQPVKIKVDIYPEHRFHGIVQSISPGSGASFSLLPPEDASGNWVKVTRRFPVRITIVKPNPQYPLRLGASATVTVNTKSAS